MIPGEIEFNGPDIVINQGRPVTVLHVTNTGDRPIQVGSHYHFAEVNPGLEFRRDGASVPHAEARGLRLHIAAGTSERFEPNCDRDVLLVPLAGNRVVPGLRGDTRGPVDGNGNGGTGR
ncbi:urease subunit beta [Streptomyces noursei]|uniref:urease subunit beta n=1 Tax=Streptomyces noursei TaxID=1971 RepID=UPI0033211176